MKLSRIMKVGLFVGVIGAILFTTSLTRARAQQFFVWEKISPCQDTRQDWFTVAQTYPGESVSTNAWQQATGPFDTFAAAMAAADAAKMGPFIAFKNRCCNDWAVWRNSQTNQFSVARTTAGPQPPPLMLERGDLCCEEAFAQAGFPVGSIRDCRNLQLSTGATVTVLPNGTFVPAQGGGGGGGGATGN